MNNNLSSRGSFKKFGRKEFLALGWIVAALVMLFPAKVILKGTFPIFTLIWLIIPLICLLRWQDSNKIGFRVIRWQVFFKYTFICLSGSLIVTMAFEPWSHTYKSLLSAAISGSPPDTTFGWLTFFPGITGTVFFLLFAGFVTIFAEELFFRGWLQQWLQSRVSRRMAIIIQATLFTLPQMLAAFLLPAVQGIIYAVVYSWLVIGLIGGWVANRTQSIWPSLASATLFNLIMVMFSIL